MANFTILHAAALFERYEETRSLIALGADLEARAIFRWTPLHCTAQSTNEPKCMKLLIEAGANIEAQTNDKSTALHIATNADKKKTVRILALSGANLNAQNIHGLTPLHLAAQRGFEKVLQFLIDAGAEVNVDDENGKNALYEAADKGHSGCVQKLLAAGAKKIRFEASKSLSLEQCIALQNKLRCPVYMNEPMLQKGDYGVAPGHGEDLPSYLRECFFNEPPMLLKGDYCVAPGYGEELPSYHRECLLALTKAQILPQIPKLSRTNYPRCTKLVNSVKSTINSPLPNRGVNPLHDAAAKGNVFCIRELIQAGAKQIPCGTSGGSPLHFATFAGHLDAVDELIQAGADLEAQNDEGLTALHRAALHGYEDIVALLLRHGANVDATTNENITSLSYATREDNLESVQLLLKSGANNSAADINGWAPLHLAAKQGNPECLTALIDAGVDIEAKTNVGLSPLQIATLENKIKCVKVLLKAGANAAVLDSDNQTLLHYAADRGSTGSLKLLLELGLDIEAVSKDGWTPLHYAAFKGHIGVLKELVKAISRAKADGKSESEENMERIFQIKAAYINAKTVDGWTALHWAVKEESPRIDEAEGLDPLLYWIRKAPGALEEARSAAIFFLVEEGAHIDAKTNNGLTALHLAAIADKDLVLKTLLKMGATIDVQDNAGKKPIDYALENKNATSIKVLEDMAKNQLTPLHLVGFACDHLPFLLGKDFDINARARDGGSPLHYAVSYGYHNAENFGYSDSVSFGSAKPNILRFDTKLDEAKTPLGTEKCVRLLIEAGASLDIQNMHGATPLHYVAYLGKRKENLKALLQAGADVNIPTHEGATPLHVAASRGSSEKVVLLLEAGAKVDAVDSKGQTALDRAQLHGHIECVQSLFGTDARLDSKGDFSVLDREALRGFSEKENLLPKVNDGSNLNISGTIQMLLCVIFIICHYSLTT